MEGSFGGSSEDHYAVLGLPRTCTASQIRNAYRELVIRWHPDKCQNVDPDYAKRRFQTIQEAYDVLSNDCKRFMYDSSSVHKQEDYGMNDFLDELSSMMNQVAKDPNDTIEDLRCALNELISPSFENSWPDFKLSGSTRNDFPQMWSFHTDDINDFPQWMFPDEEDCNVVHSVREGIGTTHKGKAA